MARAPRHRRDLDRIIAGALRAADAADAVDRVLERHDRQLLLNGCPLPLGPEGHVLVAGAGKVAAAMAERVMALAGPLSAGGVVCGPPTRSGGVAGLRVLDAPHPLPDERSAAAAGVLLEWVDRAGPGDLVIFVLTGGASAMLEVPIPGMEIEHVRRITAHLMRSGAAIGELNVVRKALSSVKAGGVARAAWPASIHTLAVSDVVGDDPAVIGSAPTVPGHSDAGRVEAILDRYEVPRRLLAVTAAALNRQPDRQIAVRPDRQPPGRSEGGPAARPVTYRVVASIDDALVGAASAAREAGYETTIVASDVTGEARDVGTRWARRARAAAADGGPPTCLLAGGETTVRVRGAGRGGRNQEVALAAAMDLAGCDAITVAAVGTDGKDGPTPAAGAIADGTTTRRGAELGDAAGFLADNDSYTFFRGLGDLVTTGPTGTNVMDLHIALVGTPHD